jgi:hypothetical protein
MSEGLILEFPSNVDEQSYDAIGAELGLDMRTGEGDWPAGLESHVAGPSDGGWFVIEVWESKAAQDTFMANRLSPALQAAGQPPPSRVTWIDIVGNQHRH